MKNPRRWLASLAILPVLALALFLAGCDAGSPQSASGVKRADPPSIPVDPSTGMTAEQGNVADRLVRDNKPGSVLHLYIISTFTGDVVAYSTVDGKVSSSGKRLTATIIPDEVFSGDSKRHQGFQITIGGNIKSTTEVLQDDGTYGSSIWYVYWFDKADRYHQQFPSDDIIIHISDVPLAPGKVTGALDLDKMPAAPKR